MNICSIIENLSDSVIWPFSENERKTAHNCKYSRANTQQCATNREIKPEKRCAYILNDPKCKHEPIIKWVCTEMQEIYETNSKPQSEQKFSLI